LSFGTAAQNLIEAEGLWKVFKRGNEEVIALRDVNLSVKKGDFVVIVGPSGSGKSTLLHLLGGVDRPSAGKLSVNNTDLINANDASLTRFRRDNIGFVFQFYNLIASLNAQENVILPLLAKGISWRESRARGLEMLENVGLGHRVHHNPGQLSGGEQQRVAIARAMVMETALILADEPTGDLDSTSTNSIVSLMLELNTKLGVTFIVATHNLSILKAASHAYELKDGSISFSG
jgi:ABC-type lipoprotein export system ATPase subunit